MCVQLDATVVARRALKYLTVPRAAKASTAHTKHRPTIIIVKIVVRGGIQLIMWQVRNLSVMIAMQERTLLLKLAHLITSAPHAQQADFEIRRGAKKKKTAPHVGLGDIRAIQGKIA